MDNTKRYERLRERYLNGDLDRGQGIDLAKNSRDALGDGGVRRRVGLKRDLAASWLVFCLRECRR